MKTKDMDKLVNHCNAYFEQDDCMVIHPIVSDDLHIDMLVYKPNEKYPFWKLVSIGASDYKMPAIENTVGLYNEYMMFVDEEVDLEDKEVISWYYDKLHIVASFAYYNETHITYAHSFEWKNDDPNDEMIAAFVGFPQIIENTGILRCKTGIQKTVACLQVTLINKKELEMLMTIGLEEFDLYLYPDDDSKQHFLSERYRSDKF